MVYWSLSTKVKFGRKKEPSLWHHFHYSIMNSDGSQLGSFYFLLIVKVMINLDPIVGPFEDSNQGIVLRSRLIKKRGQPRESCTLEISRKANYRFVSPIFSFFLFLKHSPVYFSIQAFYYFFLAVYLSFGINLLARVTEYRFKIPSAEIWSWPSLIVFNAAPSLSDLIPKKPFVRTITHSRSIQVRLEIYQFVPNIRKLFYSILNSNMVG